jgi:CrcB protein
MQWLLMFFLVGLAGGVGSVVRALLSRLDGWLPYGLFLANGLAAGVVGWMLAGPYFPIDYLTVLSAGFAGGLSTFSTAMKSSFDFYHRGRLFQAGLSMAGNLFIPMGALLLATALR